MDKAIFEDIVEQNHGEPVVFRNMISNWPASKWTPERLAKLLPDKILQCKISPIDIEGVQWETESLHVDVTLQQYVDWLEGRADCQDNVLHNFDPHKFSCYIDYKYMKDIFKETPNLLKYVDWGLFGLEGRDGRESTIWIGSSGAYTPCHYDTYGFNLVAQLYGTKRWYLVSPGEMESMYPTRIPYEESSVFSEVNIRCPDMKKLSRFKNMEVYIVDLEPGEALYVPQHWWHFVECLQPAISVNTWISLQEDSVSHLHEAVGRYLFSAMLGASPNHLETGDINMINTNEVLQSPSVNLEYLNKAVRTYQLSYRRIEKSKSRQDIPSHDQELSDTIVDRKTHIERGNNNNLFEQFCRTFHGEPVSCRTVQKCGTKRQLNSDEAKTIAFHKLPNHELQTLGEGCDVDTSTKGQLLSDMGSTLSNDKKIIELYSCQKYTFVEYIQYLEEHYNYSNSDIIPNCNCQTKAHSLDDGEESISKSRPETCDCEEGSDGVTATQDNTACCGGCACTASMSGQDEETVRDSTSNADDESKTNSVVTHLDIIKSVLHPDVIKHIANVLNKRSSL